MSHDARDRNGGTGFGAAAIWRSGFRPFFLLAPLYVVIALLAWLFQYLGIAAALPTAYGETLWHGHELLFGFAMSVCAGFVLTALPSWAGTAPIVGRTLALLAAVWCAGRVAFWAADALSPIVVAVVDCAFLVLLALAVAPGVLRARQKRFRALLLILTALIAANVAFHAGIVTRDAWLANRALIAAVYVLMVLFTMVGGFLTPIFTETHLREKGWSVSIGFARPLEAAAIATVLLVAATGIFVPGGNWALAAAALAVPVHVARIARWRTRDILDTPVLWVMHGAYAWLPVTFALRAFADAGVAFSLLAPLHAFTVGALGMMMLGLMSRVALRHTGRPLDVHPVVVIGFVSVFVATVLRLIGDVTGDSRTIAVAGILWVLPFVAYAVIYGSYLARPSLPRARTG
jgi:uncharacterized protein involved in response to NO